MTRNTWQDRPEGSQRAQTPVPGGTDSGEQPFSTAAQPGDAQDTETGILAPLLWGIAILLVLIEIF